MPSFFFFLLNYFCLLLIVYFLPCFFLFPLLFSTSNDIEVKWQLQTWWHEEYQYKPIAQSNQFLKPNHVDFQSQQIKPLFAQQFRRYLKSFFLRSQRVFNIGFLRNIQPLCFIPPNTRVS